MTNTKLMFCEGYECGFPLGEYTQTDIEYMRGLGLPLICIECTHARLEANERDRVELST